MSRQEVSHAAVGCVTLASLVAVSGMIGFLPIAAAQAKGYCISYGPVNVAIFASCPP